MQLKVRRSRSRSVVNIPCIAFLWSHAKPIAIHISIYNSFADVPKTNIEGLLEFPAGVTKTFNITTKITLNHGEYTTYSRRDGSFVIYDVGPGIHQLDIDSKSFQ